MLRFFCFAFPQIACPADKVDRYEKDINPSIASCFVFMGLQTGSAFEQIFVTLKLDLAATCCVFCVASPQKSPCQSATAINRKKA